MYTLALAGSTERTAQVAATIFKDSRFQISFVLTPQPKKIGRRQTLTKNPFHQFAEKNELQTIFVETKLDQAIRKKVEQLNQPHPIDFLLVVDFGYLIPDWLLRLPTIAPLNIHPSKLPRWRGSSPGQFVLLHGDQESAVTLMVMNDKMDEGPIIAQLPFKVDQAWTQTEYYQHSFDLICQQLGNLVDQFAQGELKAAAQPAKSPTPTAKRLNKDDSFYPWKEIQQAMATGQQAVEIERACRAYSPWPKLWTKVPTNQGEKRLIIHQCAVDQTGKLTLKQVQIEGKNQATWQEIKSAMKN